MSLQRTPPCAVGIRGPAWEFTSRIARCRVGTTSFDFDCPACGYSSGGLLPVFLAGRK
jgi:hypothetical protein